MNVNSVSSPNFKGKMVFNNVPMLQIVRSNCDSQMLKENEFKKLFGKDSSNLDKIDIGLNQNVDFSVDTDRIQMIGPNILQMKSKDGSIMAYAHYNNDGEKPTIDYNTILNAYKTASDYDITTYLQN